MASPAKMPSDEVSSLEGNEDENFVANGFDRVSDEMMMMKADSELEFSHSDQSDDEDNMSGGEDEGDIGEDDESLGSNYLDEFLIPLPPDEDFIPYEMHERAMCGLNERWEIQLESMVQQSEEILHEQNRLSEEEREIMDIRNRSEIQQAMSVAMENEEQMLQMKQEYEDALGRFQQDLETLQSEKDSLVQQLKDHEEGLQSAIELAIGTVQKEMEEGAKEEKKTLIETFQSQIEHERRRNEAANKYLEQQLTDTTDAAKAYKQENEDQMKEIIATYEDKMNKMRTDASIQEEAVNKKFQERELKWKKLIKKDQKHADFEYRNIVRALKRKMNQEISKVKNEYGILLKNKPSKNVENDEEKIIVAINDDTGDDDFAMKKASTAFQVKVRKFLKTIDESKTSPRKKTKGEITKLKEMLTKSVDMLKSLTNKVDGIRIAHEKEKSSFKEKLKGKLSEKEAEYELKMQEVISTVTEKQRSIAEQNAMNDSETIDQDICHLKIAKEILEQDLNEALKTIGDQKNVIEQFRSRLLARGDVAEYDALKKYWESATEQQTIGAIPGLNNTPGEKVGGRTDTDINGHMQHEISMNTTNRKLEYNSPLKSKQTKVVTPTKAKLAQDPPLPVSPTISPEKEISKPQPGTELADTIASVESPSTKLVDTTSQIMNEIVSISENDEICSDDTEKIENTSRPSPRKKSSPMNKASKTSKTLKSPRSLTKNEKTSSMRKSSQNINARKSNTSTTSKSDTLSSPSSRPSKSKRSTRSVLSPSNKQKQLARVKAPSSNISKEKRVTVNNSSRTLTIKTPKKTQSRVFTSCSLSPTAHSTPKDTRIMILSMPVNDEMKNVSLSSSIENYVPCILLTPHPFMKCCFCLIVGQGPWRNSYRDS